MILSAMQAIVFVTTSPALAQTAEVTPVANYYNATCGASPLAF
jgi:hypothetical protein